MNTKILLLLLYMSLSISTTTMLIFTPCLILYFLNLKNKKIFHYLKNIYYSSISFVIYTLLNIEIYTNSTVLFDELSNSDYKDKNIVIANHVTDFDFTVFFYLINNFKKHVKTSILGKKSIAYQLIGPAFISYLGEDIFLNRNIDTDLNKLSAKNKCNLIMMFPEGTCYTNDTKAKSNLYCKKNNLPIYKHLLYPRMTGLNTILTNNNDFKYIYDFTIIYDNIHHTNYGCYHCLFKYLFEDIFSKKIFININKHKIITGEPINNQLENIFHDKDLFISNFDTNLNKFTNIKYNFYNGLLSFIIVKLLFIISVYLSYHYQLIRYLSFFQIVGFYYYVFYYV